MTVFLCMFYISPNNPYCYDHPKSISWKIRDQNPYKFYRTLKRETILTVFSSSIIGIKNANLNELELIRDFSRFCCSEERGAEKVLVSQLPNGCKSLSYIHTLYPLNSILLLYCTFFTPFFRASLIHPLFSAVSKKKPGSYLVRRTRWVSVIALFNKFVLIPLIHSFTSVETCVVVRPSSIC